MALNGNMLYPIQVKEKSTDTIMRYSSDSFHKGLEKYENNTPTGSSEFNYLLEEDSKTLLKDNCSSDLTYTINDCYIFTNFEEGQIVMAYKAFPTDSDGLPMVPDDQAYIQAVKYYIAEKVGQKLYIQGKMDMGRFNHLQKERDWYVGKANSRAHLPTMDQMETWKNEFVRLIPNINAHGKGFKYLGDQQRVNTVNSI